MATKKQVEEANETEATEVVAIEKKTVGQKLKGVWAGVKNHKREIIAGAAGVIVGVVATGMTLVFGSGTEDYDADSDELMELEEASSDDYNEVEES